MGGDIAQCPVSLPEKKTLAIAVKKHAKVDIKLFFPVQFYWISLYCKIFGQDCRNPESHLRKS